MNQTDTDILTLVDSDTFWNNVDVGDPFSCWPWTAGVDDKGYGVVIVRVDDRIRSFKAHRVAYLLANDDTLGDYLVCHHCDNPPCCNPRCLFKGTDLDNQWDRVIKQNERKVIRQFREELLSGYLAGADARHLSKRYGVTTTYVKLIVSSAPKAQLDELRIKRQNRERELAGLPPLDGSTVILPPALSSMAQAFVAYDNVELLPSRLILGYLTAAGGRWTAPSLAKALRDETELLCGPGVAAPRPRDGRSAHSENRNISHYRRADLERVLEALA